MKDPQPDDIVGRITYRLPNTENYWWQDIRRDQAEEMFAQLDKEKEARETAMPNETAAIKQMFDAWLRLKELGWSEAQYCPKDGSPFLVIEPGSTGQHVCSYIGDWPDGDYWIHEECDSSSASPILFKPLKEKDEVLHCNET